MLIRLDGTGVASILALIVFVLLLILFKFSTILNIALLLLELFKLPLIVMLLKPSVIPYKKPSAVVCASVIKPTVIFLTSSAHALASAATYKFVGSGIFLKVSIYSYFSFLLLSALTAAWSSVTPKIKAVVGIAKVDTNTDPFKIFHITFLLIFFIFSPSYFLKLLIQYLLYNELMQSLIKTSYILFYHFYFNHNNYLPFRLKIFRLAFTSAALGLTTF
jgi:hypothetical protein